MAQRGGAVQLDASVTIAEIVARNARRQPDGVAFVEGASGALLTWRAYEAAARERAAQLFAEHAPGARVLIDVGDGPAAHVEMLACELAGLVGVGVGSRARRTREREHLAVRARAATNRIPTACGS